MATVIRKAEVTSTGSNGVARPRTDRSGRRVEHCGADVPRRRYDRTDTARMVLALTDGDALPKLAGVGEQAPIFDPVGVVLDGNRAIGGHNADLRLGWP